MIIHPVLHRRYTGDALAMHRRCTQDGHNTDVCVCVCVCVCKRQRAAIALLNTMYVHASTKRQDCRVGGVGKPSQSSALSWQVSPSSRQPQRVVNNHKQTTNNAG